MKEVYLSSGEFAELCDTTKGTLRHYHQIGLLKPEKTASNGYQYYSILQVYDFFLIVTLKSTGCTLEKIRAYLATPSQTEFKELLIDQLETVLVEKQNLLRREQLLRNSIEKFDLLQNLLPDQKYTLVETTEEYYIATPIRSEELSHKSWVEAAKNHLRYCKEKAFGEEYQFSYLLLHDNLISGNYFGGNYLISRIPTHLPDPRLHIRPGGRYIRFINQGGTSLVNIYDDILQTIRGAGFKIAGNAYETEISLYSASAEDIYTTEISIHIK